MKFRTEIEIEPSKDKITYLDKIFFIGSCFTENVGDKLEGFKFDIEINPFGVIYNPLSVKNSLKILIEKKSFVESDLRFHNDLWFSYNHHSSFSNTNKDKCLENINTRIKRASDQLKNSKYLFITFGTSWVYKLKESKNVVSNCHKLPSDNFERYMVSSPQIYEEYAELFKQLFDYNPDIKIVLTLSPVRHLKDGFIENQQSKANLLIALHQMKDAVKQVSYFPAYEIVMDDLRDYRFYAEDMVHPNDLAINYIWEKFKDTFISRSEFEVMNKVHDIVKASKHRSFNSGTDSHKKFVKNYLNKIQVLKKDYPYLNFEEEEKKLKNL